MGWLDWSQTVGAHDCVHDHRVHLEAASARRGDRREDSRDTSVPTLLQNSVPIPQMKAHPLSWPLNKCCIIYPERLQALHRSLQNHLAILHITARGSEPETRETDLSQHITIFTQMKHSASLPNYSCHSHACPHSMANTGASGKHWVPVKRTLVRFRVVVGPYARSHWGSGTREMEGEAPLGASGWGKGSKVNRVTQSGDSWSTTEKRLLPIGYYPTESSPSNPSGTQDKRQKELLL